MAAFTRIILSGSTNGRPISITTTAASGDLIHTVATATNVIDHVYLEVADILTTATKVHTIAFGSTATTDQVAISRGGLQGFVSSINGLPLQGGTSQAVRAWSATATFGFLVGGWVNRYTI